MTKKCRVLRKINRWENISGNLTKDYDTKKVLRKIFANLFPFVQRQTKTMVHICRNWALLSAFLSDVNVVNIPKLVKRWTVLWTIVILFAFPKRASFLQITALQMLTPIELARFITVKCSIVKYCLFFSDFQSHSLLIYFCCHYLQSLLY